MSLTYKEEKTGGDFTPIEPGTYAARCSAIIDLGTQESTYDGETKAARKVMLSFEIVDPDARRADGSPFKVSKRFTGSIHPKASLRKFLASYRGRDFTPEELQKFELNKIAGAPCLLNLTNDQVGDKTYTNITSVVKLPKGMAAPDLSEPPAVFDLDKPNWEVFAGLSAKMQEIIQSAPEFPKKDMPKSVSIPAPAPAAKAAPAGSTGSGFDDMGDDCPF